MLKKFHTEIFLSTFIALSPTKFNIPHSKCLLLLSVQTHMHEVSYRICKYIHYVSLQNFVLVTLVV